MSKKTAEELANEAARGAANARGPYTKESPMTQTQTETETETVPAITFDVGSWAGSSKVSVILDPEGDDLRVYTFNTIGSGTPAAVWHGRHRVIARVDATTGTEALLEALEERSDEIRGIAARYRGAEWNGSNHVGRWSDDNEERYEIDLGELPGAEEP